MRTIQTLRGYKFTAAVLLCMFTSSGARAENPAPEAAPRSDTDFESGGTWGLGTRFSPTTFNGTTVGATTLTLRHWLGSPFLGAKATGVDLGVGLLLDTGDGGTDVGVSALGGLPLAYAVFQHASFELVPEVSLALVHLGLRNDTTLFRAEAGARAGFEVMFGFMGIPQLALDASVGLTLALSTGGNSTRFRIATTFDNSPWDIFRATVAARYYF